MTACLFWGTVFYPVTGPNEDVALLAAGIVSGLLPMVIRLLRTHRRLERHVNALRAHAHWLRSRCGKRTTALPGAPSDAPTPGRIDVESGLLEAVETQLSAWNLLLDSAYHTCNANRFFDDFKRYARSLDNDRSLFVLLQFVVNGRYDGLVDRLRARHPTLTQYELDMLCMLRFAFTFNTIRLLHHHDNVNSLYSRRTKIRRKMCLPRRYPLEAYLSELSEGDDAPLSATSGI